MSLARRLSGRFHEVGATSRKTSKSLRDLGIEDDVAFRRVAGTGIFVNTHDDFWYLDEERAAHMSARRTRRVALIASIVVAFVALIVVMKTT